MSKLITHAIVKYKPWLYCEAEGYLGKEFTTVYDVGYKRDGKIVTVDDYLKWENIYVEFFMELLNHNNISWLKIHDSANYKSNYKKNPQSVTDTLKKYADSIHPRLVEKRFQNLILSIENGAIITYHEIPDILRIYIRALAWSQLSNTKHAFNLFVSADSYFYVTTTMPELELMKIAAKYGLYVNPRNYIDGYPINVDDYRIV